MKKLDTTLLKLPSRFKLVQSSNFTVAAAMDKIEQKVKSGLAITIDGQTVTADKDSFSKARDPAYATPTVVVAEDADLTAGAIVGIVIAVIAFVVIIIVVVYVCCIKKNSRKNATVEPREQSTMELKGRANQAYTDYP